MNKKILLLLSVLFISAVYSSNEYARAQLMEIGTSGVVGSISAATNDLQSTTVFYFQTSGLSTSYTVVILNHGDLTKTPSINDVYDPENVGGTNPCAKAGYLGVVTGAQTLNSSTLNLGESGTPVGLAVALFEGVDDCSTALKVRSLNAIGNAASWGVLGIGNITGNTVPSISPFTDLVPTNPNGAFNPTASAAKYTGICKLTPTAAGQNAPVTGTVYFATNADATQIEITAQINGLTKNSTHGIHIHSFGDLSVSESSIGGHWKNSTQAHGLPNGNNREYGDLGNICTYDGDTAYYKFQTNYFPLVGNNNIIGRSVAIHLLRDDGVTFGARIAWGVIGSRSAASAAPFTVPSSLVFDNPPVCDPSTPAPTTPAPTTPTPTKSSSDSVSSSSIIQITILFIVTSLVAILIN